jgi:hypothetical protein
LQNQKQMFYHGQRVKNMPRKTFALISGLVLVTVVLFIIALKTNNKQSTQVNVTPSQAPQEAVAPTSVPAHAVLALSPNPVSVSPGSTGSVDLTIDTQEHAVTAVQLELKYDPAAISNVKIVPGPQFQNPVVLIDKNNPTAGTYTYAIGIQPNQATVQGTGVVGKITFTAKRGAIKQTSLDIEPASIVTARGVATSVLGKYSGTTVEIGGAATQGSIPSVKGQ